jgi:hypothetical protein
MVISFQREEKFQLVYIKREWKNGRMENWNEGKVEKWKYMQFFSG